MKIIYQKFLASVELIKVLWWILMCLINPDNRSVLLLHSMHLNPSLLVCVFSCVLQLLVWANLASQYLHLYGFSPLRSIIEFFTFRWIRTINNFKIILHFVFKLNSFYQSCDKVLKIYLKQILYNSSLQNVKKIDRKRRF